MIRLSLFGFAGALITALSRAFEPASGLYTIGYLFSLENNFQWDKEEWSQIEMTSNKSLRSGIHFCCMV